MYLYLNGCRVAPGYDSEVEIQGYDSTFDSSYNKSGSFIKESDSKKIFFNTHAGGLWPDTGGQMSVTGVTDSGYHFITSDASTQLEQLKNQDVFKGGLFVTYNGEKIPQCYCRRGYAPRREYLIDRHEYLSLITACKNLNAGFNNSFYLAWTSMGRLYLYFYDTNKNIRIVWSSDNPNDIPVWCRPRVLTFVICGSGGAGASGDDGSGYRGGGGGGGGGGLIATLMLESWAYDGGHKYEKNGILHEKCAILKIDCPVGSGSGSRVTLCEKNVWVHASDSESAHPLNAEAILTKDNSTAYLWVEGGYDGYKKNGGSGGLAGSSWSNWVGMSYVIDCGWESCSGASGGYEENGGNSSSSVDCYDFSVCGLYIPTMGGYSGGPKRGSRVSEGGGGGASAFGEGRGTSSYGDSINRNAGGGGGGGDGNFWDHSSGQGGYDGFIEIIY